MGGALVTKLAARHPELVAGAVVEDPAWLSQTYRQNYVTNVPTALSQLDSWQDPMAAYNWGEKAATLVAGGYHDWLGFWKAPGGFRTDRNRGG